MAKRMLIDATHAEETRVVVLDGSRLEDFDVETANKRQLKGNIYLAKIVRVEPSLQAAFVEYGGGRHGFLAFGEIHPDYYQIPVADRQRLLAMQAEEARRAEEDDDDVTPAPTSGRSLRDRDEPAAAEALPLPSGPDGPPANPDTILDDPQTSASGSIESDGESEVDDDEDIVFGMAPEPEVEPDEVASPRPGDGAADQDGPGRAEPDQDGPDQDGDGPERPWTPAQPASIPRDEVYGDIGTAPEPDAPTVEEAEPVTVTGEDPPDGGFGSPGEFAESEPDLRERESDDPGVEELPPPETVGGEDSVAEAVDEARADEVRARRASRMLRSYRIQEVIHRRQIILVQVVKEERGTKGAALTTYISLAGRFSVLMPNSPRGGGISRKITSAADRKRLREVTAELDLPQGMGLIVRTAGANRPKPEIKRDCEYLMRLWDDIREHTMRSVAPALIYEEASLIKRAIRDVYSRDIDEIVVDGEEGWRAAHDFMRMLMPSHARKVQLWRGEGGFSGDGGAHGAGQSLFSKHQVEAQLDAMMSPTVQLKSGGYLVINQTEALVAVDVNSGRSTRERNIEETALRTNLEAADEAARQLRLRDLAGLIVIDFIDMESRRNNGAVEKRLKDALKEDRARIQVGQISHFGLLEMSRQRLRPSLTETSFDTCPRCGGAGHVRSIDSSALHVLRAIEDEGAKARASVIMVHATGSVVMYLLNNKRERLAAIEQRFAMRVQFASDDTLQPGETRVDRVRARDAEILVRPASAIPVVPVAPVDLGPTDDVEDDDEIDDDDAPVSSAPSEGDEPTSAVAAAEDGERRRRRRRRRRGGRRDGADESGEAAVPGEEAQGETDTDEAPEAFASGAPPPRPMEPAEADAEAAPAEAVEQPSVDPADLDEDGLPRARRRGRRGGRRRRRDGEGGDAEEGASDPVVEVPVAYAGPTPADPFGGGNFDIFDMIDTSGEFSPRSPSPANSGPASSSTATPYRPAAAILVPEPAVAATAAHAAPPATDDAPAEETVVVPDSVAAEATIRKDLEPEFASAPDGSNAPAIKAPAIETPAIETPAIETPASEAPVIEAPTIGAATQPVLIGESEAPSVTKRGWWRK